MSVVLYFCVFLAAAAAVSPPKPKVICCEPPQYSGHLGVYTVTAAPGHATASSTSIGNFSMDFQNGRTYSQEYVFENDFIVVQDFNKGLYWTVVNGNCTTYKLPDKHAQKCFLGRVLVVGRPDRGLSSKLSLPRWNSITQRFIVTEEGEDTLFYLSDWLSTTYSVLSILANSLGDEYIDVPLNLADDTPIMVFREFNPQRPDIEISTVVRASDCVPLMETTNTRTGETTIVTTVLYLNLTMAVADTSVFNTPPNCPEKVVDTGTGNTGHGHGHTTIIG